MSNRDAGNGLDLPELQATKRGGGCVRASTSQQEFYLNDGDTVSSDFNLYSSDRASKTIDLKWALRVFESNYQLNILENGAKMMIAFSLIEGAILNGEKILLFSQSLLTLNMIEQFLAKNYVPIIIQSNYPKLILMTMRLLKVLSVCSQNKKALINCGKRVNERERDLIHLNLTLLSFKMQCKFYHFI